MEVKKKDTTQMHVKAFQLNTGFINEDSNSTIEELFLSENVWIRQDGEYTYQSYLQANH